MTRARLTIDRAAIAANWRALAALSGAATETAAVLKADAYGLGVAAIAPGLAAAGARTFFVALAEEGAALRSVLGPGPVIFLLNGYAAADQALVTAADLRPVLASPAQIARFSADLPRHPCAVQIDLGMNRLGMAPGELTPAMLSGLTCTLIVGHLSCSDDASSPLNDIQLARFRAFTLAPDVPRSLAATGGILLGPAYHASLTRPGIGLFGGLPFAAARPVVSLEVPVLQVREVAAGQVIGYSAAYTAPRPMRIATLGIGYADGFRRALSPGASVLVGTVACPVIGRISMDLTVIDISALDHIPDTVSVLGPNLGIDQLAAAAGTIGYEILTSLGTRFERHYKG